MMWTSYFISPIIFFLSPHVSAWLQYPSQLGAHYIVETKGREDLDDIEKIKRLKQWCEDASERQKRVAYRMLYVKQEEWDKYKPNSFKQLADTFRNI